MTRRAAGGLLLVAWLAACGETPPSTLPSSPPLPTSAPGQHLTLKATGNAGEPLPPVHFDPASLPAFYYFTGDGRVGVWSGPIGRPDLAVPLVDPIPEAAGSYGTATRFPASSVVVPFASVADSKVLLLRAGADPLELLDRAGRAFGAAPDAGSFVVARTAGLDDDGIWQVWLDGRAPVQVLPPIGPRELAGREGVALGADGSRVAAAACFGDMQVRWPGNDPSRLPFGIPIGFDKSGNLLAHRDCGRSGVLRIRAGTDIGEPLVGEASDQAIVTPARAVLAVTHPSELPGKLVLVELESGQQRTVPVAKGGWDFTSDTTDRYLVLRRDDAGFEGVYRFTWAVHDLLEGWTGYFVVDTFPSLP